MYKCKLCDRQVLIHSKLDAEEYLWQHLNAKHTAVFNLEKDTSTEEMVRKYFQEEKKDDEGTNT